MPLPRCDGKVCYDKKAARTVANERMREGESRLKTYHCPTCNHWHLARVRTAGLITERHTRFFRRKRRR